MKLNIPTGITEIREILFSEYRVKVFIKRDDQIHPVVSGNKWRKLKYNIQDAQKKHCDTILTFGGAFSNHISAVARACREEGFKSIGIIRGEKTDPLNDTLQQANTDGMQLSFISREDFKRKEEVNFVERLHETFGKFYLVPEGGYNAYGVQGCIELAKEISGFSHVFVPVGTGTTLAGLVSGLKEGVAMGIAVLKGRDYLEEKVRAVVKEEQVKWEIIHDYTFGGYARYSMHLVSFINSFTSRHKIQLDPVYTGKMMFGIYDLIDKNFFPPKSKILAIHTGGLQGIAGFNKRFGNLIDPSLAQNSQDHIS